MINGLYNSASGMNAELTRQDVVSNNLANVSTVGFKKDDAVFTAFPNVMVHRIEDQMSKNLPAMVHPGQVHPLGVVGHGAQVHSVATNFTQGSVSRTDRPLDLAIHGNALFTVERGDGSTAYTRAGNFTINGQGDLVTQSGDLVIGAGGEAIRANGTQVVIDTTGRVLVDGVVSGRLQLAEYDPQKFSKLGENLYLKAQKDIEPVEEAVSSTATVEQGYLENANTQVVNEMVNMITVMRSYEANQKAIQMQDETLDKAINSVGKV